jgi:zinc/manganese transport system substrate-binding protein
MRPHLPLLRSFTAAAALCATSVLLATAGAPILANAATSNSSSGIIRAVGAESEYADVLAQVGGRYVSVSSILNNPNTDPHTFEASTRVAQEVSQAQLVVQNGVGYDHFMNNIESASPNSSRHVIVVQNVLGLPTATPNPHLWYSPTTMPAVARAMATALSQIQPSHATYFHAQLSKFVSSLQPWLRAIVAFKKAHAGTPVAVTEPVADYMLQAMGMSIATPFIFQADIMNGVDPAPQAITQEDALFTNHQVKVFCYNQQVVSDLTKSIRDTASRAGVPIVGVYETMPTGYHYQNWMLAEVHAISAAIEHGTSTEHL